VGVQIYHPWTAAGRWGHWREQGQGGHRAPEDAALEFSLGGGGRLVSRRVAHVKMKDLRFSSAPAGHQVASRVDRGGRRIASVFLEFQRCSAHRGRGPSAPGDAGTDVAALT
jgi:hypothetical protein